MKKYIFYFLASTAFLLLQSCNDRLEGDEITSTDALKIDSVKFATYLMDVNTVQTIKTFSEYASGCEGFYGYDYRHTAELERTVVPYKFKTTATCGKPVSRVSYINFRPLQTGTYTFKFFTGTNSAGEDTWHTETVEVQ